MKKLSHFVIRYRWAIILVFLGVTVFMAAQVKQARFNSDMLTYLPDDMPSRMNQQQIENLFGGTDMIMLVLETDDVINAQTLQRVKLFSRKMKKIKGIEKVMSLFDLKQVRSEDDAMLVDPAVKMMPHSAEDVAIIKHEIAANDLVYGSVVSKDFSTTAVIGMLEPGAHDKEVVAQVENLLREIPGEEEVSLGGAPYIRTQTGLNMQRDIARLLPLGIALMLLFLFLSFRQFRAVWLSSLVVMTSMGIALGAIPLLHWDFTLVTIILPVLLIAVANDYGIHMFAHYQSDNVPGNSFTPKELARRMVTGLGKPILIAGLTTIAGLLCMLGHILIPAWQMGILAAIGISFAMLASLLFLPAVNSLFPKTRPMSAAKPDTSSIGLNRLFSLLSHLVISKPWLVIGAVIAMTAVTSLGIFKLSVNTNPASVYPEGHPVRQSANLINRELGGFFPLSIVFEGDIKDPDLLQKIDAVEKKINDMPEVGITQSIAQVTRQISRALNNPDDSQYDTIPNSYNAVAQYFELYLMSGDPDDLEKMVDFSFQHAMILIRFNELDTPIMRSCVKQIKAMLSDDPRVKYIGGNADVFSEMDRQIVNGQFVSLAASIVVIFFILALAFKTLKGAALQIAPLVIAVLILFGIMGFANIDLNYTTALLSSIMIGVGIDYTIHFVWRYREERRNGQAAPDAMRRTIHTTGRGIVFNALSVIIGFAALLFSSFMPVRFFGLLMVVIIFACLIGGMLFVPALCMVLKPRFLEPESAKHLKKGAPTMKPAKIVAELCLVIALTAGAADAQQSLSAKQVQQKSIDVTRVDGLESLSTLIIINENGEERVRKMATVSKLYEDGALEKKLIRFTEPADINGTGFLTYDYTEKDDDKWIYMPALRKTRRIVSSENAKSFMGSEFSYADMSLPTVEDFTYEFLPDETVNGEPCYTVEVMPKDDEIEEANGFSKKITYISKHDFVSRKSVYYDFFGDQEKIMDINAVIEVDREKHTYKLQEIVMTNVQDDRKSISRIDQIQFNPDIPDEYFTTRYLEK